MPPEPTRDRRRSAGATETGTIATPKALIPNNFHNEGNYVISLGNVVRWLGQQTEALGVEIFPGFAAAEVLYNDDGSVKGVATGNLGIDKNGEPTGEFQLGMELLGKYTIFAEGARGHLGKQLIAKFKLDEGKDPAKLRHRHQGTVGSRSSQGQARPGRAHRRLAHGHQDLRWWLPVSPGRQQGHLGFVTGLDYQTLAVALRRNAALEDPPQHQAFAGRCQAFVYGARAITAGGILSLPKTVFPGGALVGCDAGYLNAARIRVLTPP